jgi:hypothetical protein
MLRLLNEVFKAVCAVIYEVHPKEKASFARRRAKLAFCGLAIEVTLTNCRDSIRSAEVSLACNELRGYYSVLGCVKIAWRE